jgi:hypothetical protein
MKLTGLGVTFKRIRFIYRENGSAVSREDESGHTSFMEIKLA